MKSYLIFRLYGAMASWGPAAVGGDRHTALQPYRSAILGLLGAALGIRREEQDKLDALQSSITVAVKQRTPTSLLRDFHTSQVPSEKLNRVHRSRKSELSESSLNTILSHRDYCCDGEWIVAVSLTDKCAFTLEQLQTALLHPKFTLSLGRKSCPLAVPLMPKVVTLDNLKLVLDSEFPPLTSCPEADNRWLGYNGWVTYSWEGNATEIAGETVLTNPICSDPINRTRWQFKSYNLHQISLKEVSDDLSV